MKGLQPIRTLHVIILFLALTCVAACKEPPLRTEELTQVRLVKLVNQQLYIPEAYLRFKHTSAGLESAHIQAFYPGDAVILGDPTEMWRTGEWEGNVRILMTWVPKPNPQGLLDIGLSNAGATERRPDQYGLAHYEHPPEVENDRGDVWVYQTHDGQLSHIRCGEVLSEHTVPHCHHYFYIGNMSFKVNYHKKYLPEWALIHSRVIAMYESFQSPETAQEYILNQIDTNRK